MRHIFFAFISLILFSQQGFAQEGLAHQDQGKITTMPAMEAPWSAVGQLDNPGGKYCTGTLVGTRLVLTAGHCVWDKKARDRKSVV